MNIELTNFALRHFKSDFSGTKITKIVTPYEMPVTKANFEEQINVRIGDKLPDSTYNNFSNEFGTVFLSEGYAPFCKLVSIRNFTNANVGSLPITIENYQYLRSGYSSRTPDELPVFSRWFELPLKPPTAEWLILVLYSREQLLKEYNGNKKDDVVFELSDDAEWGIVAILGQRHPSEEPMKPETMLRNALGIKEGGSGVELDRKKYLESVAFWSDNATVKAR